MAQRTSAVSSFGSSALSSFSVYQGIDELWVVSYQAQRTSAVSAFGSFFLILFLRLSLVRVLTYSPTIHQGIDKRRN